MWVSQPAFPLGWYFCFPGSAVLAFWRTTSDLSPTARMLYNDGVEKVNHFPEWTLTTIQLPTTTFDIPSLNSQFPNKQANKQTNPYWLMGIWSTTCSHANAVITTRTTFASNQHVLIKLWIHCFCSFIPFSCTSMIIYMILLTSLFSEVRGNTDITQIQPSTARHTHTHAISAVSGNFPQ